MRTLPKAAAALVSTGVLLLAVALGQPGDRESPAAAPIKFRYLGHAHTPGDAVAYLPKHKILCTGDACVNGAFNFMGHSNSASWISCLEKMAQFDVRLVCPGHGPLAGKDVIGRQKRYFQELRTQVKKALDAGKALAEVIASIDMPWYK